MARWLVAAVVVLLLLPYLLTPLYRGIDPVSTLMLALLAHNENVPFVQSENVPFSSLIRRG
ncbi:MAG: hypothetical protein NTV56_08885, partial [Alphaproteobacteria bacterium]|nr:hypothetical protein [Alphaproteobacteria bacterium]